METYLFKLKNRLGYKETVLFKTDCIEIIKNKELLHRFEYDNILQFDIKASITEQFFNSGHGSFYFFNNAPNSREIELVKYLYIFKKAIWHVFNNLIQFIYPSSNLGRFGEFFIVKIKARLVLAFVLTKIYKVGREPQGVSLVLGSSANELRLEQFCDWVKPKKQNAELPLNASEQDSPADLRTDDAKLVRIANRLSQLGQSPLGETL